MEQKYDPTVTELRQPVKCDRRTILPEARWKKIENGMYKMARRCEVERRLANLAHMLPAESYSEGLYLYDCVLTLAWRGQPCRSTKQDSIVPIIFMKTPFEVSLIIGAFAISPSRWRPKTGCEQLPGRGESQHTYFLCSYSPTTFLKAHFFFMCASIRLLLKLPLNFPKHFLGIF